MTHKKKMNKSVLRLKSGSGRGRRNNPNRCDFLEYFWQMLPTLSNGATIRTVVVFQLPGGELCNRELAGATI